MRVMRTKALGLVAMMLLAVNVQAVAAVNFDDIAFAGGDPLAFAYLPTNYHGLIFKGGYAGDSWVISPNDATGWFGGTKQPYSHSGNNFAWNNAGSNLEIAVANGATFDLQEFWIRSWPSATFNPTARGYLKGVEIYSSPLVTTDTYLNFKANFIHIDLFAITLAAPRSLLVDDISISNITSVPEPANYLFMLIGLTMLGARIYAKRKSSNWFRASN